MIYVQYHKGQPQPGLSKDNIRSLRNAIEDLLDYIPYLLHLRQLVPPPTYYRRSYSSLDSGPSPTALPSQMGHYLRAYARPTPMPGCHGCARDVGDRSQSQSVSKSSPPKTRPTSNLRTSKPRMWESGWTSSLWRNRATIPTPPPNRPVLAQPRSI
jgi:hypothetical protein